MHRLLELPRQRGVTRRRVFVQKSECKSEVWCIFDDAMRFTARTRGEWHDKLLDDLCDGACTWQSYETRHQ